MLPITIMIKLKLVNMMLIQDCEATDLRALQQGEKVKPHKVVAKNNHIHNGIINKL